MENQMENKIENQIEVKKEIKNNIVFICDRKIMSFFEDYINTFHHIFNVHIFLFSNTLQIKNYLDSFTIHNDTENNNNNENNNNENNNIINNALKNTFFIFMQFLPSEIIENIHFYIKHQYKLGLFNTEQLSRAGYGKMINSYHPYFYRVDYSEVNLLVVANELKKVYLPYQVHHREIKNYPKNADVCIVYPYKSERRYKIINELKNSGIHVDEISGFLGSRDEKLFRYKILLNIHFDDDYNIFEEMRCNRCIMNQMIVVSEKSWYDDLHLLRRHFLSVDYDKIVAKVKDVLINYDLYHSHLFRSFEQLLPVYDNDLQNIASENINKVFS